MKRFSLPIQKMDVLIAVYIFCITAAEIMGAKTFPLIHLFGRQWNASVAIFLFPLIFTINDVIYEVYGRERVRSVVFSGFIVIALIVFYAFLTTSLPPSTRFASTNEAYTTIFRMSIRISIASLAAFGIAGIMDILVFSKIRKALGKKALWLRNNLSNFIAQFFDTAIFMTLAFYALDQSFSENYAFLVSLILPYWLMKCAVSVSQTPLVYLGVKWLKR
jgi:queuosine precursor transporter